VRWSEQAAGRHVECDGIIYTLPTSDGIPASMS
jgi:hypothetical protein